MKRALNGERTPVVRSKLRFGDESIPLRRILLSRT
jgi:hypothetical protein